MAKQIINLGTAANDGSGDPLRTAFTKINTNFTELYTLTGGTSTALTELAQDYAAPMFTHASHVNITAAYDDANNKIVLTGVAAAQVQTDWNAVSGLGVILNKPTIPSAYTLPTASSSVLGGIKIGTGLSIDGNGVVTASVGSVSSLVNGAYSVSVGTDGVVSMVTSRGTVEFGALPEPGGPSHFHIMKAAGDNNDLYFGDDFNYVLQRGPAYSGNPGYGVEIGTQDLLNSSGQHVWRFGTDGSITFPDDTVQTTAYTGATNAFSGLSDATSASLTIDEIYLPAITRLNVSQNTGGTAYRFDQYAGIDSPVIYAISGTTIAFNLNTGHPFSIRTSGNVDYDTGLVHVSTTGVVSTGNSAQGKLTGTLYWKIPVGTTGNYRYTCANPAHVDMFGAIIIKDISVITDVPGNITWIITESGSSDYVFSGPGIQSGNTNDPVLYLYKGTTYKFINNATAHPFAFRVSNGGADYTNGVSGSQTGTQTFTVPMNAPSTLYYQCTIHSGMGNVINIV
jgi:plastocyanin